MPGHIVAIGGGGFNVEPDNPLLDDFILGLSRKKLPRICFIPTARGDSVPYVARFYRAFSGRAIASDLTTFDDPAFRRRPATSDELPAFMAQHDIFYVGGGNTAQLLATWRIHGIDKLLRREWRKGKILCGVSAGMLCWFEGGITDSFGDHRYYPDGLGFLRGSASPHYHGEANRIPIYRKAIADGTAPAGYAADDGCALHFVGTTFMEAVSSRPEAGAYRLTRRGGKAVETAIPVRYLGKGQAARRS